jgi:hypothetical protein
MRTLLPPSSPSLRQLPLAGAHATLVGLIAALPVGLLFYGFNTVVFGPERLANAEAARWLSKMLLYGPAYAVTMYLFVAVPSSHVRRLLIGAPSALCAAVSLLAALSGGLFAHVTVAAVLGGTPSLVPMSRVAVVDGFMVMAVVTVISVWSRHATARSLTAARAQTKVLQAQINPHFFFNTLNTISSLIPVDPTAAQETLGRLADMSRYAFSSAERHMVPLSEEIEFARAYLEIEQARFGSRLRFELPRNTETEGLELPPLTLQPLVENAVRHGIAKRPEGGSVSVRISREGSHFAVVVENDMDEGTRIAEAAFFQPSHALTNIRSRLRLIYRDNASVAISIPRPRTLAVTIRASAPS